MTPPPSQNKGLKSRSERPIEGTFFYAKLALAEERVLKAARWWKMHWDCGDLTASDNEVHPADKRLVMAVNRLEKIRGK